jgi:hypothetical protein
MANQEFEGVKVFKSNGNLNRDTANTDNNMALVISTQAFPAGINANDVIETVALQEAEAVGIDAAFDANNTVLAHYHIEEFYDLAPEGKLVVVLTDEETAADFFALPIAAQIFKTYKNVKNIGFVYNGEPLELDLDAELGACQAFITALATDHYLLNGIYLEGRNLGVAATDNRELNAPNCNVVIAQDPAIAVLEEEYEKYAAVGSALGMRAVRKPSEHLGSTDILDKPDAQKADPTYPLTRPGKGRWLTAALSDGTPYDSLTATQKQQLTDRAYIYAGGYSDFYGVYFNGEPTCVAIESDYSQGENNNIWNKAARGIRKALLPKVKSQVFVDPATGNIRNTSAKYLEGIGFKPLEAMMAAEEISGATLTIPTNQSPSDQVPLKVQASVTKNRIVHLFEVSLGLN